MDMQIPSSASAPSPEPHPEPPVVAASADVRGPNWRVAVLGGVGVLLGAGAVALLIARAPSETSTAAGSGGAAASSRVPSSAAAVPARPVEPRWTRRVQPLERGQRAFVYALEAENDVAVWAKRVRPTLMVRCVAGDHEVLVVTESAPAMEGSDGRHTVQVAFDAGTRSERWYASDDYVALFAPDGESAVRQMSESRTLRFGFTPYNGAPVTAEFNLSGFEAQRDDMAKNCKGKPRRR